MKHCLLIFIASLCAAGCGPKNDEGPDTTQRLLLKPDHDFAATLAPPAPDYRSPSAWAALPERADAADQTPDGLADLQAEAAADVFFIHPTTYFNKAGWNAPYTDSGEGPMSVEGGTMRAQASAFNGCCRVFAPRYRQATLYTFLDFTDNSQHALDFAYQDIAAAFENFIAEKNNHRPFIIASHSQGSYHAMRLIEEHILGDPVQDRLIAVYAIGGPVPEVFARNELPVCATATQTNCIIGWNTISEKARSDPRRDERALIWLDGAYQPISGRKLLCVNPLNWEAGGAAHADENLGALPGKQTPERLSALLPASTGAACRNGYLVIDIPEDAEEFTSRRTSEGSYHVFDYNLFYLNIRENASARTQAHLAEQ